MNAINHSIADQVLNAFDPPDNENPLFSLDEDPGTRSRSYQLVSDLWLS